MSPIWRLLLGFFSGTLAAAQPNILWLTSEDHGPEIGCYGDPVAQTPHVDALAAAGLRFQVAWSNYPVCAPARTAILAGVQPYQSGGMHMRSMVEWPAERTLFPERLREAGYACFNNVKEDYNLRTPVDLWTESSRSAHWRKRAPGQPFFAIFNSTKSHESQIRSDANPAVTDPAAVRVPAYHPDTPEVRRDWARYYDSIHAADADAGARLAELAADGLAEDTIVFYFGDHGAGMPRSKRWPSHSGLSVPLIVYFPPKWQHLAPPGYEAGGVSTELVGFTDLAPTVLSLAGIAPPDWMQGRAFAGTFRAPAPEFIFGGRDRMDERTDFVRSVTDGRYVYLRNYHPELSQGQHVNYQFETATTRVWREWFDAGNVTAAQARFWTVPKPVEELYDLTTDRDEVNNLAGDPAHRVTLERMRSALRSHQVAVRDLGYLPEAEMLRRFAGRPPAEAAANDALYPFDRIHATAERAAGFDPELLVFLWSRLSDPDAAVRYWALKGLQLRSVTLAETEREQLHACLADESPSVRIAAAEVLARQTDPADRSAAWALLVAQADPTRDGMVPATAALEAMSNLGAPNTAIRAQLAALPREGPSPDARYNSYLGRLIETILAAHPAN